MYVLENALINNMEYELSKRLIEVAEVENKVNRRFNLSVFLSLKPQINKAIKDGWSIKFIWETLSKDKKIHIGYRMFLRMVKQHANHSPDTDNGIISPKHEEPEKELTSSPKDDQKSEQTSDGINVTSEYPATGNPKGFEWSTEYDVKDFL